MPPWPLFRDTHDPHNDIAGLPAPPRWRPYARGAPPDAKTAAPREPGNAERGKDYLSTPAEHQVVSAALYLRRPLLITGPPGTGKTTLAYAVAYQLQLGPVLLWAITTRSTLQDGLYRYDAVARLQDVALVERSKRVAQASAEEIGRYLSLGPLGTALLPTLRPRVLLIDEIDKSDIDLPNDLLNVFEEGAFEIPELKRLPNEPRYDTIPIPPADNGAPVPITRGRVECYQFPFVVLTSNGEREFPPAFLRRCLRLNIEPPKRDRLAEIVSVQLQHEPELAPQIANLIEEFVKVRESNGPSSIATDQLLNAVYLAMHQVDPLDNRFDQLRQALLRPLGGTG